MPASFGLGAGRRLGSGWLAPAAVVLIPVGLFVEERTAVGIPGVWFPFGTGVSRTQFAYAAFDGALFALLLRGPRALARHGEAAAEATIGHVNLRSYIPFIRIGECVRRPPRALTRLIHFQSRWHR